MNVPIYSTYHTELGNARSCFLLDYLILLVNSPRQSRFSFAPQGLPRWVRYVSEFANSINISPWVHYDIH